MFLSRDMYNLSEECSDRKIDVKNVLREFGESNMETETSLIIHLPVGEQLGHPKVSIPREQMAYLLGQS